jgi:O-antigen ligase
VQPSSPYRVYPPLLEIARSRTSLWAGRPRLALMTVLVAAAMPIRAHSIPFISSASILDALLLIAAVTLFLDLAFRPIDIGYSSLFWLLSVPLFVSILSFTWSADRAASLKVAINYAEGLIAYLFVVRELEGLSSTRIVTYIKRYSYLLIIPAVLLLLHVPGFEPRVKTGPTSGDYLGYFSRLSHPVIGASNNLATVLAFFAPILLYWGHTRHDRAVTRAGVVTLIAIGLTLSRGIALAFVIAGLLYLPWRSGRRDPAGRGLGTKVAAAVALGAVAIGVFYAVNAPTSNFFKDRASSVNVEGRADLYSYSLAQIEANPVLGGGAGVVGRNPPTQLNTNAVNLDLHSSGPVMNSSAQRPKVDVHNAYLQQAIFYGLPLGLLVSLALCSTAGVFLARGRMVALAGVIAYALMVQLISFLFEGSFEGTLLRVLFYLSIGLATALLRSVEQEQESPVRVRAAS